MACPDTCEECDMLLQSYRRAVRTLSELTGKLTAALTGPEKDLMEKFRHDFLGAHVECDRLRRLFIEHYRIHVNQRARNQSG